MRRQRAVRISAPPPLTRITVKRSRTRWPLHTPGSPVHEFLASSATVDRRGQDRNSRLSAGPGSASDPGTRGRHHALGAAGAARKYSALCPARTWRRVHNADSGLVNIVAVAFDNAPDHARRLRCRGYRRHRARFGVQPIEMAGIFAVPLRGDPAGHAGDCDCTAAADLSAAADRRDRLRLDRRILSGAVQYHAGSEFSRPKSSRPVSALWRLANADAVISQIALRSPLHTRR